MRKLFAGLAGGALLCLLTLSAQAAHMGDYTVRRKPLQARSREWLKPLIGKAWHESCLA
jgi:hypothetical protein